MSALPTPRLPLAAAILVAAFAAVTQPAAASSGTITRALADAN